MRKRLQESLRKLQNGQLWDYNIGNRAIKVSDVFTAAYKKLKRRGNLLPFAWHRESGALYKRELFY